jgi:Mg2+ and Co2+ transporter CorA
MDIVELRQMPFVTVEQVTRLRAACLDTIQQQAEKIRELEQLNRELGSVLGDTVSELAEVVEYATKQRAAIDEIVDSGLLYGPTEMNDAMRKLARDALVLPLPKAMQS